MTDLSHSDSSVSDSETCPLGARWAAWKIYVFMRCASGGTHLTPQERAAILRAGQRHHLWKPVSQLPIEWSVGPGDSTVPITEASLRVGGAALPASGKGFLTGRRHLHASTTIGKKTIHVDWATGTGGGPGFSYKLVRIYVNGVLVDEAAHGGCSLGFTLWASQAVAPIRRGLAVGFASEWFRGAQPPPLWLMTPDRGK